ncbi:hypothetical protein [Peribacillus muralis]|uniref:hypothetical protein n=1 Tax=Peribacillus muralis TaxID=264697 RepID=UPI003D0517A8
MESTYKGLAKSGMKKPKAKSISKLVISLVAGAVGYTVRDIVVILLKRQYKTYNKKGKMLYVFGKK